MANLSQKLVLFIFDTTQNGILLYGIYKDTVITEKWLHPTSASYEGTRFHCGVSWL